MAATTWSSVSIDVQSALATAMTVSGITKANPGVVSFSGTDPSDGDFVVFPDLEGMTQMRDRVARVDNTIASTSFEVEGIDTSGYGTWSDGDAQVITFGTSISTFVDVSASGGEPNFADITTIHDNQIVEIPTTVSPFELSFESQFDVSSNALTALNVISDNQTKAAVRITFPNGNIVVFYAYITAALIPTGSAQDVVTTNVTMKATGRLTAYAS